MVSITVLDYFMDWIHRCKLSKLYNSHGQVIQVRSSWWQRGSRSTHNTILPFLPDDKYAPKESYDLVLKYLMHHQRLGQQSKNMTKHASLFEQRKSWALVTGASRGIGRAIVISLARRDIPIVLVARDRELLERLSKLVQDCYGVQTLVIATDLCQTDAAHYVALELERNQIHVEILINNAGIGDTRELVTMSSSNIDALCQVNVTRTTQLTQILGAKMKEKRAGRIAFVSSLAGAVPGVPHAAVYAAAKAYQKSLATSLGREMEWYGIGVTCILPGAVRGTNFASRANMEDAAIWEFPFGILDPEIVSECTVNAVILGRRMVVVGWMNALLAGFLSCFLPARFIVFLCEFGWKALPFATNKKTA
jgi:short-subunit dehydrogenase